MQVMMYSLPTIKQGRIILQKKVDELLKRMRNGGLLAPEEQDWLNWAELQINQNRKTQ